MASDAPADAADAEQGALYAPAAAEQGAAPAAAQQAVPPADQQEQQQQQLQDIHYWFSSDDEEDDEWDHDLPDELDDDDFEAEDFEDWEEEEEEEEEEEDEEDLDGWQAWVEVQADALSVSSDEPEEEAAAAVALAAATAGRAFAPAPAAYAVPTASNHFQSADALAVAEPAPDGSLLAAVFDREGVAAYRLPPPSSLACRAPARPPAARLGGFQAPRDVYALALSPCGRFIAAGGDAGLLAVYAVDATAPPRPPRGGEPRAPGVLYFYTPLNDPAPAGAPGVGPPAAVPAPAAAAGEAAGPSGQGSTQRPHRQPQHRAPRAVAALAHCLPSPTPPNAWQPRAQNAMDEDAMLNGLRFGLVGGKLLLLAAEQSGYLYVLEVPPPAAAAAGDQGPAPLPAVPAPQLGQGMLCSSLGTPSGYWQLRPINLFPAEQLPHGARVSRAEPGEGAAWWHTAAIGPFGHPCNFAVASPDGRYIAVTCDSQRVAVVDQAAGFAWRTADFDVAGDKSFMAPDVASGAQYAAFNASSTLLAVSSDTLHAVFVLDPASLQQLYRVEGHKRPCLPVCFVPWNDSLLLYAEETKHVWARDVRAGPAEREVAVDIADPQPSTQLLRLPLEPLDAGHGGLGDLRRRRLRVTGMAASRHGDLLVATKQGAVLRYLSARPWRPQDQRSWPARFQAAARELLSVVAALAGQAADWVPVAPQQQPAQPAQRRRQGGG
eukprot:scaffold20.g7867.t1